MNHYITGTTIKSLREARKLTQAELGEVIGVSDKTISKWETGKGLPDVTLIEPLAQALGISVTELLSGEWITNGNKSSNMRRSKLYVCPLCGNVIHSMGEAVISCCGITLPVLEEEAAEDAHPINVSYDSGEFYVTMDHPMTKEHYISFLAYATDGTFELKKLYPEGEAEARFFVRGRGKIFAFCNVHGLMTVNTPKFR